MLFNKNHPPSYTMYVFYGNVVHFFLVQLVVNVNLYHVTFIFYEHYHLHNKYVIATIDFIEHRFLSSNLHNIRSYMQFPPHFLLYCPLILRSIINKSIKLMHMFLCIG